ncbi:MAG: hypothetical protein LBR88_07390 [Zoogloeaceae bacterium]|nr:hypothetical protein [Zoogloeaceae bacterium]
MIFTITSGARRITACAFPENLMPPIGTECSPPPDWIRSPLTLEEQVLLDNFDVPEF